MKRGEVWTSAGGPDYAGKPRPALILQSDLLTGSDSLITCGLTSQDNEALPVRPFVERSPGNGLSKSSSVMVDKIMTVPRKKLRRRIGAFSGEDMSRVEDALSLVLGLSDPVEEAR